MTNEVLYAPASTANRQADYVNSLVGVPLVNFGGRSLLHHSVSALTFAVSQTQHAVNSAPISFVDQRLTVSHDAPNFSRQFSADAPIGFTIPLTLTNPTRSITSVFDLAAQTVLIESFVGSRNPAMHLPSVSVASSLIPPTKYGLVLVFTETGQFLAVGRGIRITPRQRTNISGVN